jgi:CAAX prenyl protease-like protein
MGTDKTEFKFSSPCLSPCLGVSAVKNPSPHLRQPDDPDTIGPRMGESSPARIFPLDRWVRDDIAYILPMGAFLGITFIASTWPSTLPACYIIKTIVAGALLILLRKHFTKISWNYWQLGILVGIIGVIQWVGMEKALLHFWPNYPTLTRETYNPFEKVSPRPWLMVFLFFRLLGPALVVPFMEEYFWRDFLWRTFLAPNDFKLAAVGEWDAKVFWGIAILFASEHVQWLTAIVWAVMIGYLLVRTRSLGACIVAHGVTNLMLGVYVLYTHDWWFW